MSTLILEELYDGITFDQPVRIQRDANIVHVRPWIYKHGTLADGDFQLEVLQGATVLATQQLNYTDINDAFDNTYGHGFIRFDFDSLALHVAEGSTETEFTFRFTMQNHTTDVNNFLGIVRNWEVKFYDTFGTGVVDNQAPNDMVEPAGLEIYSIRIL